MSHHFHAAHEQVIPIHPLLSAFAFVGLSGSLIFLTQVPACVEALLHLCSSKVGHSWLFTSSLAEASFPRVSLALESTVS